MEAVLVGNISDEQINDDWDFIVPACPLNMDGSEECEACQ